MKKICVFLCVIFVLLYSFKYNVSASDTPGINSEHYLLIDRDNGQVLMSSESDSRIYPASMTKIMTLLIGVENISDTSKTIVLDETIFNGLYEANASMAGFYLNEVVTLKDCLYGLFLPSGAETTRAIAISVAGSEEAFVKLMNHKAAELGLDDTHFTNTTGLHDTDHYTTLKDLAILLEYCLQNETFKEIFYTKEYISSSGSFHQSGIDWQSTTFHALETINDQSLGSKVILGGKTGYTNPAGLCLASIASHDHRNYMLITSLAPVSSYPYHVIDAINIYNDIYTNYTKKTLYTEDEILGEIPLNYKWFKDTISFKSDKAVELTLLNEVKLEDLEVVTEVLESVNAPVSKGQVLGNIQLFQANEMIYQFNVVANEDVQRSNSLYTLCIIFDWISEHLWISIVGLISLIILLRLIYVKYFREKRKGYRRLY